MNRIIETSYKNYPVKPFISPELDIETWLLDLKPVSKRNMICLKITY